MTNNLFSSFKILFDDSSWEKEMYERIDAYDNFPFKDSANDTRCTKSLYLSNQLTILSTVQKINDNSFNEIWKCYDWTVWTSLIILIFILTLLTTFFKSFRDENNINKSIIDIVWQYLKPMVKEGEPNRP